MIHSADHQSGFTWRTMPQLAWHDLRARYAGAALGFVWSVIQPLVMAVILWVVIQVGFRARHMDGVPFIAWLLPGMAAWSFFAEALNAAAHSLHEYAFLVKKVRFPVLMLPPVKIISTVVTHLIFLAITAIILLANGIPPTMGWLWLPFYFTGLVILLTGLGWITAALHAFSRDVGYIVGVLLQFGFWLSPVFWTPDQIADPRLAALLRLNPLCHILEGYRACLLTPARALVPGAGWFWPTALITAGIGLLVFRRLQSHFADVL